MAESALTYTLQKVPWQFFGTLTFRSARVPERKRITKWFALARKIARWHKVNFPKLVWALRMESGEISGRLHYHFLLANLPLYAVQRGTCFSLMAQWEKLGGGMARVREYDSTLGGLDYFLKCLHIDPGANAYEVGKFSGSVDGLLLSDSMWNIEHHSRVSYGLPGPVPF